MCHKICIFLGLFVSSLSAAELVAANEEIAALRATLASQQAQIAKLQAALDAQSKLLDRLAAPQTTVAPSVVEGPESKTEAPNRTAGGFRFSGDFRFRLDALLRSGNEIAAPLQNVRSRYRLRLNIDKQLDPRFEFHTQLSTGPFSNPITNDQDMAGMNVKHPFSISEAWINFRVNDRLTLRGGRVEEIFTDEARFLWDDDLRFNGFNQTLVLPAKGKALGFTQLEFRAGVYILSNPAVYILAPSSPYVSAGYAPGGKVRAANLFHPGFVLHGNLGSAWKYHILGTMELYRNANQIQLASTTAGVQPLAGEAIGITLPRGLSGTGNATTLPDGAMYYAPHFQIAHLGYRLERKAFLVGGRELPAFFDFEVSRNVGTSLLRDAFAASVGLGAVKQAGDLRFLYQYSIKDANSMISQFTDDDLGSGAGVNTAVHGFRVDVGLTRFLQWQNLLFVQDPRRGDDPTRNLYVPLRRGANTQFRYQGQLAFRF